MPSWPSSGTRRPTSSRWPVRDGRSYGWRRSDGRAGERVGAEAGFARQSRAPLKRPAMRHEHGGPDSDMHRHDSRSQHGGGEHAMHSAGAEHDSRAEQGGHDGHDAHAGHGAHAGHDAHAGHGAHAGHDKHAGHSPGMFRDKFWLSLALTVPTLIWGHMLPRLFGYTPPMIPGSHWIAPV